MIQVTLVGTGNVSQHLAKAFLKSDGVTVNQVVSSRGNALSELLQMKQKEGPIKHDIEDEHIYIIAVSDDAISTVAQHFKKSKNIVLHTSGSVALDALHKDTRRGVFYPLQTFSKEREVDVKHVPICIETGSKKDLEIVKKLAYSISDVVHEVSSAQRLKLHLAAVIANNFTNHMYAVAADICNENKLSFDILKPLILETAKKINTLSPTQAQTGPAKRGDNGTIKRHIELLKSQEHKDIYQQLTKAIKTKHGKEL